MSNRGVTKKADMKAPANANPQARLFVDQIKQAVSGLNLELPEEAVGVGAKWEFKEMGKGQASAAEQGATCELTALEGDKLTAKFSTGSGAGGSALGTAKIDLTKPVASSAEINIHTEVPMRDKNMVMRMDINMTIESQ
jgi:hypothetical protein